LDAEDQPENAHIETKVNYRVGRAYLCLTNAGAADYSQKAEEALHAEDNRMSTKITNNPRILIFTLAEAYANLGLLMAESLCIMIPNPKRAVQPANRLSFYELCNLLHRFK
jgi:hypothetical protein